MKKAIMILIKLFSLTSSHDLVAGKDQKVQTLIELQGCTYSYFKVDKCGGQAENVYRMDRFCTTPETIMLNQSRCCKIEPKTQNITIDGKTFTQGYCISKVCCFPEDVIIISKAKGNITMAELRLGDQILAYSKQEGYHYSRVLGWFHKKVDESSQYLKLTDSNGSFFHVSPLHSLALENGTYDFARNVGKQRLFHTNRTVERIQNEVKKGVYAPYTEAGNYFVVKSDGTKTLAHCTSNMYNPQRYEWFVRLVLKICPQSLEQTHPAMKLAESQILLKFLAKLGLLTLN